MTSAATAAPSAMAPPGAPLVADQGDDRRRILTDDVVRPAARSGKAYRIRKWPGRTIRYYETIPKKWDWSLDQAIDHWNSSGGKIKFVEVPKRRAKLVIRYGNTGGADGLGTIGYQYTNFVYLSSEYKKANEFNPETRVWVGRLFAHELGHVLGYDHTGGQCSLMYPVYDFGACPPLPYGNPGYYNCRWIDKKLLRRFTKMYGGKPKQHPRQCLVEALPGELRNLTFSGGNTQAKPVRVSWQPPAKVLAGTKVFITAWKGASCSKAPNVWELRVGVDPKTGAWTDPGYAQGTWCYLVQIQNRYGATRAPTGRGLARYAPVPGAPAVGTPAWHAAGGGWRFTWSAPTQGMSLAVMRDHEHPDQCVTTYDPDQASFLDDGPGNTWLVPALAPEECLNLFVVTDWATVSPATQVQVEVPEDPAAPTPGPWTWDPDSFEFDFSWTPPNVFTSLHAMRHPADPDVCPTTYDEEQAEWLYQDVNTGTWSLSADYEHPRQCVSLFAVTGWGTASAPTTTTTEVPAPTATPVVGAIGPWSGDAGAASATVSLSNTSGQYLGIEVVSGACPAQPPANASWWDGTEDWEDPGRWYFYPEPWANTGPQCAMFAALDSFGQVGPVVKRSFTVAGP